MNEMIHNQGQENGDKVEKDVVLRFHRKRSDHHSPNHHGLAQSASTDAAHAKELQNLRKSDSIDVKNKSVLRFGRKETGGTHTGPTGRDLRSTDKNEAGKAQTAIKSSPIDSNIEQGEVSLIFGKGKKKAKTIQVTNDSVKRTIIYPSTNADHINNSTSLSLHGSIDHDSIRQHSNQLTIASLPEEERQKIQRLVDRLVDLGKEHESTIAILAAERARHSTEIDKLSKDIDDLKSKLQMSESSCKELQTTMASKEKDYLNYLNLYQRKIESLIKESNQKEESMKQSNQMAIDSAVAVATKEFVEKLMKQQKDVAQLEALCQSQRSTLDTYEATRIRSQQAHETVIATSATEQQELKSEITILRKEVESVNKTNKHLQQSLDLMTQQSNSLRNEIEMKDNRIKSLEFEIEEAMKENQTIKTRIDSKTNQETQTSNQPIHDINRDPKGANHTSKNIKSQSSAIDMIGFDISDIKYNPSEVDESRLTSNPLTASNHFLPMSIPSNVIIPGSYYHPINMPMYHAMNSPYLRASTDSDLMANQLKSKKQTKTARSHSTAKGSSANTKSMNNSSSSANKVNDLRKSSDSIEMKQRHPSPKKSVDGHSRSIRQNIAESASRDLRRVSDYRPRYDPQYDSSLFVLLDDIETNERYR